MARKSRIAAQRNQTFGRQSDAETAPKAISVSAKYNTAIYARLSVYNLGRNSSETIDNQIMLLERYVEERPELSLVDLYIDNGKTGTNFERPEFSRLINDVKQGRIN